MRTSACGRWRVVTRSVRDRRRGTVCRHDLYDGDPRHDGELARGGIATLAEVRAEIDRRIEGERSRLAVFRDQDRYFVPVYDADAWAELERRGMVTLHEDDDGDTYAERVSADRSAAE